MSFEKHIERILSEGHIDEKIVKDLQVELEAHTEVVCVLAEIIATISQPKNAKQTIGELHESLAQQYPDYFDRVPKGEAS